MIRRATADDAAFLADMAVAAHREAGEAGVTEIAAARRLADHVIERGAAFLSANGALAAVVIPSPVAPSWRIAAEVFWRVEPHASEAMLRAFTAWARDVADEARVSSEAVGALALAVQRKMRREGYTLRGATYVRRS